MQVIANGQPIPFSLSEEQNLKELLQTLFILSNKANKLVLSCKVNGQDIPLIDRNKYATMPIASIEKIELVVETKSERVIESLKEIDRILTLIIKEFSSIYQILVSGQKHKAMTTFSETLESWRSVINFLRVTEAAFKFDFATLTVDGKSIDKINKELYTLLAEIKRAIEANDLVSIGDLIEYELKAKLEEQRHIVGYLQQCVQAEADKVVQSLR